MGWTYYTAKNYNGEKVDRKKECDNLLNKNYCTLLKSAMVGSTWYGAVKINETGTVNGTVMLTKTSGKGVYNFGYKDLSENSCPLEAKCPLGILKLLTPTDNDYANEWRNNCYKYHEEKKTKISTSKVKDGQSVRFTTVLNSNVFKTGEEMTVTKIRVNGKVKWLYIDHEKFSAYYITSQNLNKFSGGKFEILENA